MAYRRNLAPRRPDHRPARRVFIGYLALGAWYLARPAAAADEASNTNAPTVRDWQRLRGLKGHFDGAAWNNEVDRWQGQKHRVMQTLADGLVRQRANQRAVQQTLGRPDARLRPGEAGHDLAAASLVRGPGAAAPLQADARRGDLWLYRWRGQHDQLVLVLIDGRVRSAGWLQAGE